MHPRYPLKSVLLRLRRPGVFVWLTALALRLGNLGKQGLFLDEAWSWDVTRLSLGGIFSLSRFDPHPPLYYLLLKTVLRFLPPTEVTLRLVSVIFSLLALASLLWMARRWWGDRAVFLTGLLTAFSSFDVYYAQEARMYTLLAALVVASTAALLVAWETRRPLVFAVWGLLAALLPWTHAYGLLYLLAEGAAMALWALRQVWPRDASLGLVSGALGGLMLAGAGAAPAAWMLWGHRQAGAGGAWIPSGEDVWMLGGLFSSGLVAARAHFLDAAHLVSPFFPAFGPRSWAVAGMMAFSLPFLWWGWRLVRRKNGPLGGRLVALTWVAFFPPAAAFVYALGQGSRVWAFKPLLGSALLLYLLAGAAASKMPSPARVAWIAVSLFLAVNSLWPYYRVWQKTALPAALRQVPASGERVLILRPAYLAPVAYFYAGTDIAVWGVNAEGRLVSYPSPFTLAFTSPLQVLSCDTAGMQRAGEIWVYGETPPLPEGYPCLSEWRCHWYAQGGWRESCPRGEP